MPKPTTLNPILRWIVAPLIVALFFSIADPIGRPGPGESGPGRLQAAEKNEDKTKNDEPVPKPLPPDGRTHFITFDDLKVDIEADSKYRAEILTDEVKKLNGQRIKIKGFMFPGFKATGITQFPFVKNTQCKFGPGGTAWCVMLVDMKEGLDADYTTRVMTLEGRLTIEPYIGFDGNTWSLYRLVCDKVR